MFKRRLACLLFLVSLTGGLFCPAQEGLAALRPKNAVELDEICNPHPQEGDIILPMPGGLFMTFRLVAVPAKGLLWDMPLRPGRDDTANPDRAFYDRRFSTALSASFSLEDLPQAWHAFAPKDGGTYFFYLMAKYELSTGQWRAIMDPAFTRESLTAQDARPKTDISWYDAVDFTRQYTSWLLKNAPANLPHFQKDERNTGFLRLPTEAEWEYAARGGQNIGSQQLLQEDFFPLPEGTSLTDYAVYRPLGLNRLEEGPARIGSRRPNPLNIYDMAGNVAEMVLDTFRFSVAGRLHGSAGGFVRKGGSYLSDDAGIMPGRREETPFFLANGPTHARDLGFRPVIAGINTPGGSRPEQLAAAWKDAGEGPAPLEVARNPLEELDRLLAQAQDETSKNNLQQLRATLKENNIIMARQKQLEAESLLRTCVYMIETIRNYSSRQRALEGQYGEMLRDKDKTTGASQKKLLEIIHLAERGLEQFRISLEKSLAFYVSKIEDCKTLDDTTFTTAFATLEKDFSGQDPFNENMRQNLELLRKHATQWRTSGPRPRGEIQKELLERRFQ